MTEVRKRRTREYSMDLAEFDEMTCLEDPCEDDDATIAGDEEVVFTVGKPTEDPQCLTRTSRTLVAIEDVCHRECS